MKLMKAFAIVVTLLSMIVSSPFSEFKYSGTSIAINTTISDFITYFLGSARS